MLKIEKEFVLFVFEEETKRWEIRQFNSSQELDKVVSNFNHSKSYFSLPLNDLKKYCKDVKHSEKNCNERYLIIHENECFVSTEYPKTATSIVAMSEISQIVMPYFYEVL